MDRRSHRQDAKGGPDRPGGPAPGRHGHPDGARGGAADPDRVGHVGHVTGLFGAEPGGDRGRRGVHQGEGGLAGEGLVRFLGSR